MSLPQFDVQGSLFESLGAIAPDLFADSVVDQYHGLLQQRRHDQQTEQFKERMQQSGHRRTTLVAATVPLCPSAFPGQSDGTKRFVRLT
jgi:hypothetical protein